MATPENFEGELWDGSHFFGDREMTEPEAEQMLVALGAYLRVSSDKLTPKIAAAQRSVFEWMVSEDAGLLVEGDVDHLTPVRERAEDYLDRLTPDGLRAEAALVRFPPVWHEWDWYEIASTYL